ncbi:VOC family protein [Salimicrobium flavidum]|uniref:Glyoxalase superfamily enzyme, possibly 3-demethylubiquinone-9 3-methyltransferase n=1 Tax=Salimicrobium flavidum TaxID=570947 RepID=A0A1N7K1P6_9BACI|nr:Glyoxalase superfamily enzyme, possibly 3-demethylubiquinone-9 3-methyltransferase [Salimicrobium flavidum]
MAALQKITPCLWFDTQAEQAAQYYTSIFPDSSIGKITHYTDEGKEYHGKEAGEVMTVEFTLDGQKFLGLNGGTVFTLSPSVSFIILCADQEEVDYYWNHLSEGGREEAQQCGWLEDKFGLSWQVEAGAVVRTAGSSR